MDTKSGYPFWVIKNGLLPTYPSLERDQRCDVLVIGGGITGALIADHLSRHGHDTIVVEKRDIGWGATAASTALIQYEIDAPMTELAKRYDETTAALAYSSCVDAVRQISDLATQIGDVGHFRSNSLYLASTAKQAGGLIAEQTLRTRYGIPSRHLGRDEIRERYNIAAEAALFTRCGAVLDPYRFTCRLLARCSRRGVGIYDRTTVAKLTTTDGGVTVTTTRGASIRAKYVIFAAGYETQAWLRKRVARNRSTYAFISDPVDVDRLRPFTRTMIWDTQRPYHYLRTTSDHRVLVGGEDDHTDVAARRDRRVKSRAERLVAHGEKLLQTRLIPAFSWAGTFAETKDALPYFGATEQRGPRVLYAMAYGGNGITYSLLGATLLRALIERRPHPLRDLYAFSR